MFEKLSAINKTACSALAIASVLLVTHAKAADALVVMQAPQAESVGTTITIKIAVQTLLENFDVLSTRGKRELTSDDLKRLAQIDDNGPGSPVRDAARLFLVSPLCRSLVTGGQQGNITKATLKRAAAGDLSDQIAKMAAGRERRVLGMLLRDPGLPAPMRWTIVDRLSDREMLELVGPINAQGSPEDKADETTAFLYLARLSWLGYAEASAISKYSVPYTVLRGADDHSASYWDGKQVRLSENMISGGTGVVNAEHLKLHIGIFAHESGHAIAHFSGLTERVDADAKAAGLTHGLNSVIGEAIAGVFQGRAHVAATGYDKKKEVNLVISHDVEGNIDSDQSHYAKYYHVDTAAARAQMPQVRQLLADEVVPFFQEQFGLLDDPQLAQRLPSALH